MKNIKFLQGLWCAIFMITSMPLQVCAKQTKNCCGKHTSKDCNEYDFVIVGAGNTGCVLANRLSENGKYSVCVVEYGVDDARARPSHDLPEPSPANVPQPGDFNWGLYARGTPAPMEFPAILLNRGFGHLDWYETEDENGPVPSRPTTYARHSGWGGCTAHNFTISIRNAPYNWNQWLALGLTDWDASTPSSNLIKFYEKVENRSQLIGPGTPFYDPTIAEPNQGAFPSPQQYYGYNGYVPLLNFGPPLTGTNPYTDVLLNGMSSVLGAFNYPNVLVDLDWPPTADQGGLSTLIFHKRFSLAL